MFPAIGLEVHVELSTKSKMFCGCANDSNEKTSNINVCPICLGHPGTLPVINGEAIKRVIKVGLALDCDISEKSFFDRKNYFYPDLPKGYQISQLYSPLCKNGFLMVNNRKIRIREIHLEEDTCRLSHDANGDFSLVDCNRAGVPLMELVTEPDIKTAQEAKKFAQELRLLLRYLDVSGADMEKGQMRIEPSVSVSQKQGELGVRAELKNINSFRAVERSIVFEIARQKSILEKGKKISQQTRGWDSAKQETVLQRIKETADDYRYFPEPDLPFLEFTQSYLDKIRADIPELPWQKRTRLAIEYGLSEKQADILTQNKWVGEYFEKVISELPSRLQRNDLQNMTKLCFNYLTTDLLGLLSNAQKNMITPENFAELITMIFQDKISSKVAKDILKEMLYSGGDPSQIAEEKNLLQTSDELEVGEIMKQVLKENEKAVADFHSGKENSSQFLLGKIMAKSRGKANPDLAQKLLKKFLS